MKKLIIKIELENVSQLHVGSGENSYLFDAGLFRRVNGKIVIPGTTFAGVLRFRATKLLQYRQGQRCWALTGNTTDICTCPVCKLFGQINPDTASDKLQVSKLIVHDAVCMINNHPVIRDGVGMDRKYGTARTGAKFDYEAIPQYSTFQLLIEGDNLDEDEEKMLAVLLAELDEGRITVGGKSARGLGALKIRHLEAKRLDWGNDIDKLLEVLMADDWYEAAIIDNEWYRRNLKKAVEERISKSVELPDFIMFSCKLSMTSGFITKDNFLALGSEYDAIPHLVQKNGKSSSFIPGSLLRGVIRRQGERILRTLAGEKKKWLAACDPFEDDLSMPECSCAAKIEEAKEKDNDGLEKFYAEECPACKLFGSTDKGSRLKITDAAQIGDMDLYKQDFLAIDRFTGGGSEHKKFDTIVLNKPVYEFKIHLEEPEPWETGLLLLILRDIHEGLVSFGAGSGKGFGQANLQGTTVQIPDIGSDIESGIYTIKVTSLEEVLESNEAEAMLEKLQALIKQVKGGAA